ncbi:MAG: hypothetical protein V1837_04115 [Candidatus Woesearchaeota archaeon]
MKPFIIILLIIFLPILACSQQQGIIQGKVSIGPLCPVERNPPDPNCQPTLETFRNWPIGVYSENTKVGDIMPDSSGTYTLDLNPGVYTVKLELNQGIGRNLPMEIVVKSGETTSLDVNIDTGIR